MAATTRVAATTEGFGSSPTILEKRTSGRRGGARSFLTWGRSELVTPLLAAALVACGGGSGAAPTPPLSGPTQKLQTAAAAMRTAKAFRFTAEVLTGTQQVRIAGDFTAPDALHEIVTVGASSLELVKIGTRTFRRDSATAPWQAVPATSARSATDPRGAFSTLAGTSAVKVEGAAYFFSLNNGAAANLVNGSNSVTGSAVIDGGRIVDLKYQSNSPSVSVHLTYGAFNTAVVVTPPPIA